MYFNFHNSAIAVYGTCNSLNACYISEFNLFFWFYPCAIIIPTLMSLSDLLSSGIYLLLSVHPVLWPSLNSPPPPPHLACVVTGVLLCECYKYTHTRHIYLSYDNNKQINKYIKDEKEQKNSARLRQNG